MTFSVPIDPRPYFPGLQSVTYRVTTVDGSNDPDADYTLTGVSVRTLSTREINRSNGMYLGGDTNFAFSQSVLDAEGIVPKARDVIIFDSVSYRVLSEPGVRKGRFIAQTKVTGRNFAIAYNLNDLIQVYRNTGVGVDINGRNVNVYTALHQGLGSIKQTRLQPVDFTADESLGVPQLRARYECPVEFTDTLRITDQIRVLDGRILELVEVRAPQTVDSLMILVCDDNGARWDREERV